MTSDQDMAEHLTNDHNVPAWVIEACDGTEGMIGIVHQLDHERRPHQDELPQLGHHHGLKAVG